MTGAKRKTRRSKPIDLPGIKATLAKLDALVAAHPELTSKASQGRLSTHLDREHEKGDEDGDEEGGKR